MDKLITLEDLTKAVKSNYSKKQLKVITQS